MNISPMLVTPEVSQLEISALKFAIPEKSSFISVMPETSQPAMGPYFFSALDGFLLKAWTASFRESLLVKVPFTGDGGASGGDGGASGAKGTKGSSSSGTC